MSDSLTVCGRPLPRRALLALGAVRMTGRHLRTLPVTTRRRGPGDRSDVPAPWPAELVDAQTKTVADGRGPLFHRTFTVHATGATLDAAGLITRVTDDLDDPAPPLAVAFDRRHSEDGDNGSVVVGDEFRVHMPAPWDGPVRVLARGPHGFRFGTLSGHLEAGQIEFRAVDEGPGRLSFTIEAWSRAGDRGAEAVYRGFGIGKEAQAGLWIQYCLGAVRLSGGRRVGRVAVTTRTVPETDVTA